MLAGSLLLGAAYVWFDALSFTECFHFVEYGLLAWLFYRSVLAVTSRAPAGSSIRRPETLASADMRTLKRALYDETETAIARDSRRAEASASADTRTLKRALYIQP
jgi:hypothetical protein